MADGGRSSSKDKHNEDVMRRRLTNTQKEYICTEENVEKNLCNSTDLGKFLLDPNWREQAKNNIISDIVHLKDPQPFNYPVNKTGFYCVFTYAFSADEYKAAVEFRNAYGELAATNIAKLPFYGGLTIVYAVVAMSVSLRYSDSLPLTNVDFGVFSTSRIGMIYVRFPG